MTNVYSYVLTSAPTFARLEDFKVSWRIAKNYYLLHGPDVPSFRVNVVYGMNSERFPRSPYWRVGDKPTTVPDRQTGNGLDRRGHTACYWGHVQEWRQALGENDADFDQGVALFFEDDCRLDPDFWARLYDEALPELPPDWEILYLGGELCVHGRPRPAVYSEHLYKANNVNRTHAYAVRLCALPKIILWFEEHHDWGHNFRDPKTGYSEAEVDYALGSLTETGFLNGFALRRWATEQAAGFSSTQGRTFAGGRWELN